VAPRTTTGSRSSEQNTDTASISGIPEIQKEEGRRKKKEGRVQKGNTGTQNDFFSCSLSFFVKSLDKPIKKDIIIEPVRKEGYPCSRL
jgi:hypothetical protein